MELKRVGTQASIRGPAETFTGTVRIDPLMLAQINGDVIWSIT